MPSMADIDYRPPYSYYRSEPRGPGRPWLCEDCSELCDHMYEREFEDLCRDDQEAAVEQHEQLDAARGLL